VNEPLGPAGSPPPLELRVGAAARPRRPRWHRWAAGAGIVAVVVGGVLAFLRSPFFAADRISVQGTQHLSEAKVLRLADLREGANVVSFDAAAAERRLEADPWIAAATITKDLPDAVAITISERAPLGTVEGADGWGVLAADGTVLSTQPSQPRLPILVTAAGSATDGLSVLASMDPDLRARVASVSTDPAGEVTLSIGDGVTVAYGTVDETQAKAQSIAAVLAWAKGEHADVVGIDVRVPGAPTARLAGGGTATP
jgi:cell division protein FtsQ